MLQHLVNNSSGLRGGANELQVHISGTNDFIAAVVAVFFPAAFRADNSKDERA
jgi:hypothetical protein